MIELVTFRSIIRPMFLTGTWQLLNTYGTNPCYSVCDCVILGAIWDGKVVRSPLFYYRLTKNIVLNIYAKLNVTFSLDSRPCITNPNGTNRGQPLIPEIPPTERQTLWNECHGSVVYHLDMSD